jgi:hypothetical protein
MLMEAINQFQPQPDPLAVEEQQLKIAKLKAEIAEVEARTAQLYADAQKKRAEADQANLDTVEQETGTKHERDLEKQKAQAQGNASLEVTKALLKPRKRLDGGEDRPNIEGAVGWNELSKRLPTGGRAAKEIVNNGNLINRDIGAQNDPRLSLNSSYFDGSADPALNPGFNL